MFGDGNVETGVVEMSCVVLHGRRDAAWWEVSGLKGVDGGDGV